MQIYQTIQLKIIGVVLICIFAFAITPVSLLHNLFADHIDTSIVHHHKKTSEIAKAGIDCHTQNFVAERNFLSTSQINNTKPVTFFTSFSNGYKMSFFSRHHFYAELRGPPSALQFFLKFV